MESLYPHFVKMKIKKLIKDIPSIILKGPKEISITGVSANSTLVAPGNLFIARKGKKYDGSHYISEAIAAGAAAIVSDVYDPTLKDVCQLIHPHVADVEGLLAAHYYEHPSRELFTVGISGTNGKTTTSFLIKHLLDEIDGPCGVIGTVEYIVGKHRLPATHTTPDACSNQKMLREMVLQGCRSVVMEVSSHALDQQRVSNIDFDVAIFTNLTSEHLDYHGTIEQYARAKQKLFSSLDPAGEKSVHSWAKVAIVNGDDRWHAAMVEVCRGKIFTYGIDGDTDLRASDLSLTPEGSFFQLHYLDHSIDCHIPLIGRHNVYNYMAALSVALVRKRPFAESVDLMKNAAAIPGRLESVANPLGLNIYVDFAHTPDALKNVLVSLQGLKKGRLFVVFGCGGDRDRGKRPKMAEVAAQHADVVIVTSDNPRSEDPQEICREIALGFSTNDEFSIEVDRAKAIQKAIEMATKEDIILIAGKGHEPYQVFACNTIEFDDRKTVSQICRSLHGVC